MASQRELYLKGLSRARFTYLWFRVIFDYTAGKILTKRFPSIPGYPALYPYPYVGMPIYGGDIEGDLIIDPGYSRKSENSGLSLVSDISYYDKQQSIITATLNWSGDSRLEAIFSEPGNRNSVSARGGGSSNPIETNLLIIYVDRFKSIYGYDADVPPIITYRYYYRISWDAVVLKSNGLPETFSIKGYPLEGTDQNGNCLAPGAKLFFEWKANLDGDMVDDNGTIIDPNTPSVYIPFFSRATY